MATIKLKRSTVAGVVPSAQNLVIGELAVNTEDGYIYALRNDSSTVRRIGTTADRVSFQPPGIGTAQRTAQSWMNDAFVSVKNHGAIGDGVADDTDAINLAIAYLATIGGGTLFFPQGTYKVTSEILIDSSNIRLMGTGKRGINPGVFVPTVNTPSTIMPVHTDRCAFRFYSEIEGMINPFTACNINIATLEDQNVPQCAFGWDCSEAAKSQNNFTFDGCGIYGFATVFDMYGTFDGIEMRSLKVFNCNINRNKRIAFTELNTYWSSFVFRYNEAGYNGTESHHSGIFIAADACTIEDNRMEYMTDPIKITGTGRGTKIAGNYFKGNTGVACIQLQACSGFSVGPNVYSNISDSVMQHKVLLTYCAMGACIDPYWSDTVHKVPPATLGSSEGVDVLNTSVITDDRLYSRVDKPESFGFSREPNALAIATLPVTVHQREIDPISGFPMPVEEFVVGEANSVALNYALVASAGEWVALSWLFKQQPGKATANPIVSMIVDDSVVDPAYVYDLVGYTNHWRAGEWSLITCAFKVVGSMSSLSVLLKPHGNNPEQLATSRYLKPVVYVTDDVNKVVPYVDPWLARSCIDTPEAGTWKQGDTLFNSVPTDSMSTSFVCVSPGTPGEWVYT